MKTFVIGDTHFLHNNIVKYCNRPINHNELMIKNWRDIVNKDDTVIHLGDIAAGYSGREELLEKIFETLPGKRILIRGNHDHKSDEFYKEKLGFEEVTSYFIFDDILFFHYPLDYNKHSSQKEKKLIDDMKKEIKNTNVKYLVHGHIHNNRGNNIENINEELNLKTFNVSVEVTNYKPVDLELLIK